MHMSRDGHSRGGLRGRRPGLLFGVLLALACGDDGDTAPRDVVRLDEGEVQLPAGARRHDVQLEGVDAQQEVQPAAVDAQSGDAISFNAADGITHSIVFLADQIDSAQAGFLDRTGQMRGPPLLSEGSTWIVSLSEAPAGEYRFACALHGGTGVIRVGGTRD